MPVSVWCGVVRCVDLCLVKWQADGVDPVELQSWQFMLSITIHHRLTTNHTTPSHSLLYIGLSLRTDQAVQKLAVI